MSLWIVWCQRLYFHLHCSIETVIPLTSLWWKRLFFHLNCWIETVTPLTTLWWKRLFSCDSICLSSYVIMQFLFVVFYKLLIEEFTHFLLQIVGSRFKIIVITCAQSHLLIFWANKIWLIKFTFFPKLFYIKSLHFSIN